MPLQQRLDFAVRGDVERRLAGVVLHPRGRALLEQQDHRILVSVLRREVERRVTVRVLGVRIRAFCQEQERLECIGSTKDPDIGMAVSSTDALVGMAGTLEGMCKELAKCECVARLADLPTDYADQYGERHEPGKA